MTSHTSNSHTSNDSGFTAPRKNARSLALVMLPAGIGMMMALAHEACAQVSTGTSVNSAYSGSGTMNSESSSGMMGGSMGTTTGINGNTNIGTTSTTFGAGGNTGATGTASGTGSAGALGNTGINGNAGLTGNTGVTGTVGGLTGNGSTGSTGIGVTGGVGVGGGAGAGGAG
ncbi:MAG: hypothetical protein JO089_01565, partial [Alphaproteobacteria bacterium]|nr:hypothetical protein [Alphaproteobacteria bacterium]